MKILRKLTSIYTIVFVLLAIFIIATFLSFKDMDTRIAKISKLTGNLVAGQITLSRSESNSLHEIIEEIHSIRIRGYIFFAIALLISSIGIFSIAYMYRKGVLEPLRNITSATQKMAQGHFEKLNVIGGTEISMLAESFNSMGRTLNNKLREFEETVHREKSVVRTLNILNELNSSVIRNLKVEEILEIIISSSTTLIKSEIGAIILIDRQSHEITHFVSSLQDTGDIKILTGNIIHELIDNTMPIRLSTPSKGKRFTDMTEGINIKINDFLAVPIMIEGQILGGLILINKMDNSKFTMEDEDHALMVSFQGATAIEKSLYHEEIIQLARTDGLTGLINHRTFHEQVDTELKRARRFSNHMSLLLIDIDHFKKFNDTYGHQAGDAALRELASVFKKNLRGIDYAARYGGEEFTIILPETAVDGAFKTAERIRKEVESHPFVVRGKETHLTVSIGISEFPNDSLDKEDLIKASDDALYLAKRLGRNRTTSFKQYKAEKTR